MKHLILILIASTIFTNQMTANIIEKTESINIIESEKSVVLNLSTMVAAVNEVRISNINGEIVYSSTIKTKSNKIKYNLEALPNGTYEFQLFGDNFIENHMLLITSAGAELVEKEAFFKPMLRINNGAVLLNALNLNNDLLSVNIYDGEGNLVFEDDTAEEGNIKKSYSLTELPSGSYTVSVSSRYFTTSTEVRN